MALRRGVFTHCQDHLIIGHIDKIGTDFNGCLKNTADQEINAYSMFFPSSLSMLLLQKKYTWFFLRAGTDLFRYILINHII